MAIEIGAVLEGTVTGVTNFGAFVDLGESTGLVHISEVSNEYVKDIKDHLKVDDVVKVKVLGMDKGKISLSIKQTQEQKPQERKSQDRKWQERKPQEHKMPQQGYGDRNQRSAGSRKGDASFEDKISRFLKDSDERLTVLKRNTESKRGGRGGRRA